MVTVHCCTIAMDGRLGLYRIAQPWRLGGSEEGRVVCIACLEPVGGLEQLPHSALSPESSNPQRTNVGLEERGGAGVPNIMTIGA
jgi:hypothetical protein